MHPLKVILILILPFLFLSCGDPEVDVTGVNYQDKIVVDGFLYASEGIHNIKIMRNIPLGSSINVNTLYLTPSNNSVIAKINGIELQFDPKTRTYFNYNMIIEYGKTYKLEVTAVIDGKQLNTQSSTTVPD